MPDPRITSSYVGAYDVTPDYNPIIGPSPVDGLFLATGFSGHGFKISPAVGKLVADLLTDGKTTLPNVEPTTSDTPDSPRTTCCSASIPTRAQEKCDDILGPEGHRPESHVDSGRWHLRWCSSGHVVFERAQMARSRLSVDRHGRAIVADRLVGRSWVIWR